jgi:DNA-binding NtrC family response regulator
LIGINCAAIIENAVSPGALARLQRHDWPGNVRELEDVIEQVIVLGIDLSAFARRRACELGYKPRPSGGASTRPVLVTSLHDHQTVEQTKAT